MDCELWIFHKKGHAHPVNEKDIEKIITFFYKFFSLKELKKNKNSYILKLIFSREELQSIYHLMNGASIN